MSSAKQHHLSIINEEELNNITTYLKGNIHVKYYILYKLKNFEKCWFIYFQHPNSIRSISLKFNNVYTLLYRGPSKNLIQFIKTNGKFITEYGTSDNLNLKSSLKRELTENEFIEPCDIIIKTTKYLDELEKLKNKKSKKNVKKNTEPIQEPIKKIIQKNINKPIKKIVQESVNNPDQEIVNEHEQETSEIDQNNIINIDQETEQTTISENSPEKSINNPFNQQTNIDLETPETEIEETDTETNHINSFNNSLINKTPNLDPFKEQKKNLIVRAQPISKNDINIEHWKENIHIDYKEIQVLWIWGSSDVDKSDRIKRFIKDNEEKYGLLINVVSFDGKYWKGVGEKANIAIYDGFKENHMSCYEFLEFIDKEIHELPTLSGNIKNRYNLIIISSVFNPEYIYVSYNEDIQEQIKKSINKVIKV